MSRRLEVFMWVSLFGAPIAWAGSHVIGWGVSEANCNPVDRQWGIAFTTWEWAMLVLAFVLAVGGLVSSTLVYRDVKGIDKDAGPPGGRLWLLSISGIVVSSLLLVLILITHTGALLLGHCHQG